MKNSSQNNFINVNEIIEILGVSRSYAYKLIKTLNEELKSKGFMTIDGRVSRCYFNERFYGMAG